MTFRQAPLQVRNYSEALPTQLGWATAPEFHAEAPKATTNNQQNTMEYHFRRNALNVLTALFVILNSIGYAEIVTGPRSIATKVGNFAYFNCSTSLSDEIQWFHYPVGADERTFVYGYDKFYVPYEGRFEMEKNGSAYNLVIPSVKFEDAGKYECQDNLGSGDKKSAQLTALEQGPICQSSKTINKVIGPNSCGIEPDNLVLTCTVQYHGNEVPILEWRHLISNDVISKGITRGSNDTYVTLSLTMIVDNAIDDTSYLCQTIISTPDSYSCQIGPIEVLGKSDTACSSYVIAMIVLLIIIGCFIIGILIWLILTRCRNVRTNKRATEQRGNQEEVTPLENKEEETEVDDLNPNKTSKMFTNAKNTEQLQKDKRRLEAEKKEMQQEINHHQQKLIEMEQHLYPPENITYLEKAKFLHTIRSDSADMKAICGIAILDPSLFVVFEKSQEIEVYESVTYSRQPNLTIKEMTYPLDITSSKARKCFYVYVFNQENDDAQSKILGISHGGVVTQQWATDGGPGRLSSFESSVIACLYEKHQICEYSGDGKWLRTIPLSPAHGINHPLHALKVTSMHFIVSHGDVAGDLHRVCVVDLDGKIVKKFSEWIKVSLINSTEKLKVPICLAENSDRFIIVADRDNKQILLLNSVLKFKRKLIVSEDDGVKYYPIRLAFDEKGNLLIAENSLSKKGWQSGRVSVFSVKNPAEQNS